MVFKIVAAVLPVIWLNQPLFYAQKILHVVLILFRDREVSDDSFASVLADPREAAVSARLIKEKKI